MSGILSEILNSSHAAEVPLRKAYAQFVQELNEEEREIYTSTTLEGLLLKVHDTERLYTSNNLTKSLGQRLQPVLYNLERYGRALDVFVQIQFTPISLIWGSLRILLEVGTTFLQYFNILVDMIERLCDNFNIFRQYEELFGENLRLREALSKFYYQMLLFLRKAHKTFSRSSYKILFTSLWRTFETDYRHITKALTRDTTQLNEEIALAWRKKVLHKIDSCQENQKMLQQKVDSENLEGLRREFLEWLVPAQMAAVLEREANRRSTNSGSWLRQHEVYRKWVEGGDDRILWINGKPGSGKSVLSTSIIHQIQNSFRSDSSDTVAYFFCNRDVQGRQSLLLMLSSFISQVLSTFDYIPDELLATYRASLKHGRTKISTVDRPHTLLLNLAQNRNLYIVVDGIDEAGEIPSLLTTLKDLVRVSCNTRVVLLSRDIHCLREELHDLPTITMEPHLTQDDLNAFLAESISMLGLSTLYQEEIYKKLSRKADGMFLWAQLMMRALHDAISVSEIQSILDDLPAGLNATYHRVLADISAQSAGRRELARKLFLWTCYGIRPLKWAEVQVALASISYDRLNKDVLPFKSVVNQLCSPLIEYDTKLDMFRPAHHSVREFITSFNEREADVAQNNMLITKSSDAHLEISRTCFKILTNSFTYGRSAAVEGPLEDYAVVFWCDHLTSCSLHNDLKDELLAFLDHPVHRSMWIAKYLFQQRKDFPLQRLMKLQKRVKQWLTQEATEARSSTNALDWMQDVIHLLVQNIAETQQDSMVSDRIHCMLPSISYFEKLMVVRDLSREYTMTSRLSEAIQCMTEALQAYAKDSQVLPIEGVWVLNSLGILYDQQHRTELAIRTQLEALTLQEQVHGKDHLESIWTVNELGRLYRHSGAFTEAVSMHERALPVLRRELDSKDLQIAWTLNTLARTLRKQSRYEDAIKMHEEALQIQRDHLENDHPHILWALSDIARCKGHMDLLQESKAMFELVLNGRRSTLGVDHPDTLWSMNDLALAATSLGEINEAKALYDSALRGQVMVLGEDHEHTIWTQQRLVALKEAEVST